MHQNHENMWNRFVSHFLKKPGYYPCFLKWFNVCLGLFKVITKFISSPVLPWKVDMTTGRAKDILR